MVARLRKQLWASCLLILYSRTFTLSLGKDGLIVPLRRVEGGLIARGLLRNATLPLHGAVKDYGYFSATLMLGSPPRTFSVIVDTGSTITYVPCNSCGHNCGPHHKDAAFDPVASSTSSIVGCGTEKCVCGRPACGCSSENQCTYSRTYAEQSSSSGLLIEDKLLMGDSGFDVVFGCETKETGEIYNQEADGIMGLGNSEVSLVNQLAAGGIIDDVFSLCFGSVEGDGALLLGDVALSQYNVELRYTPLLASQAFPHYYSVQLLGIQVGDTSLSVPAAKYEQGYGTVLDSGTTFTYLPSQAFKQFKDAVTNFALSKGLKSAKGPDPNFSDVCFKNAPLVQHADQLQQVFPQLELQFQGDVKLKMGPLNYLFMHTVEAGAYCLGIFDNGQSGTLLGGITFRNILVEYDRRNQRVGFGAAPCQALGLGQKPCPSPGGVMDGSPLSPMGTQYTSTSPQAPCPAPGFPPLSFLIASILYIGVLAVVMIFYFLLTLAGKFLWVKLLDCWKRRSHPYASVIGDSLMEAGDSQQLAVFGEGGIASDLQQGTASSVTQQY